MLVVTVFQNACFRGQICRGDLNRNRLNTIERPCAPLFASVFGGSGFEPPALNASTLRKRPEVYYLPNNISYQI